MPRGQGEAVISFRREELLLRFGLFLCLRVIIVNNHLWFSLRRKWPTLPLPKGTQSFSTLRLRNELYVDKTAMIYELTRFSGTYFIARPRRFGKSLLLSTVESLFKKGLEEFQGLAIEHL